MSSDLEVPSARDRIVRLLASGGQTTEELARALGVTPNAVRAQLALLRRERVIEEAGQVRGKRRPSTIFRLRPGAETRLSRAYPVALSELVRAAAERLRGSVFVDLLRAMGRGMAASTPRAQGNPEERVKAAAALLEELGSRTKVSRRAETYTLSVDACPLGEAVSVDNRTCVSMATMLHEVTGLAVTEKCEHGTHPRCSFEIRVPPSSRRRKKGS